jgi:hypothetical protein
MSSAIDLRNCPVPAIVPPVPSESFASDSGRGGYSSGLTGTSDETDDFTVRLAPYFRTGAGEMRVEVAAVLQREFSTTFPHVQSGSGSPRIGLQKSRADANVVSLLHRMTSDRCHCHST